MARTQGTKFRSWAAGGDLLGINYDTNGNPSNVFSRFTYSNESILGSNHRGPPYRSGGPMLLIRTLNTFKNSSYFNGSASSNPKGTYKGRFQGGYVPTALPLDNYSWDLSSFGTQAIARTIPTSPSAGLSVFLGELRDFPGMIRQTRDFFHRLTMDRVKLYRGSRKTIGDALGHFSNPRAAAGDYLNLQFGWLPFLRDLVSFYETGRNIREKVAQIRRNNMGKPVTRYRVLQSWDYSNVVENFESSGLMPTLNPVVHTFLYHNVPGAFTRTRTASQYGKVWFKATYRYYSPEVASAPDWVVASDILGLRLDPAVIYQLLPWSWLLDWFTTTGSIIGNAVAMAHHHVVIDHGFVMAHRRSVHDVKASQLMRRPIGNNNYAVTYVECQNTCLFETKERVVATPFGFGVNWDNLSAYQLSILAALGITRRRSDQ